MRDGADDTHAQRHSAERIFGAGIGRNTYQIHRDSYSAIWPLPRWLTRLIGWYGQNCHHRMIIPACA